MRVRRVFENGQSMFRRSENGRAARRAERDRRSYDSARK